MMHVYAAEHRRVLTAALRSGAPLECPVCGAAVQIMRLPPAPDIAYVRNRVRVRCTGCRRTATLDLPVTADGPP